MRYLSVCSGIEAATVAWHPLGWEAAAFSEIEAFPRAVLSHHYPTVPLHGDFTTIGADDYGAIDLLVGGTPCQSFSIAGLRGGMADGRGNLALEYIRLARRKRARWVAWENVPGVFSSNGGDDFRCFLSGLAGWQIPIPEGGWQNAGVIAPGPADGAYGLAWRVLDAQYFGVPQRRRRVFVVGYIGDWRRAAAVLFERQGLQGNPAPRREKGQNAPTIPSRSTAGGGLGTDFDCDGGLIADWPAEASPTLDTYYGDKMGLEDQHVFNQRGGKFVRGTIGFGSKEYAQDAIEELSPPLRAMGSSKNHPNGGGQIAIAIQERAICENPDAGPDGAGFRTDGMAYTLEARSVPQAVAVAGAICRDSFSGGMGGRPEGAAAGHFLPVAFQPRIGRNGRGYSESVVPALNGADAGATSDMRPCVASTSAVRRLTPRECERLQGFPDDYTLVPWRKKQSADGPRYKALGNSMAVPCMKWIGERIQKVEDLTNG